MKDQHPQLLRAIIWHAARQPAVWSVFRNFASLMATNRDVRQRGSGPLSGERVGGPLRPAVSPPPEPNLERTPPLSPIAKMRRLSAGEFNAAMIHFYRGEVQRSNIWRNRLDTTTYWAVITAGATLSFTFSSPLSPHFVIPINSVLVAVFLMMEARRYRYYEIWASRVRVLETGYFAQLLAPESLPPDEEWAAHLASENLSDLKSRQQGRGRVALVHDYLLVMRGAERTFAAITDCWPCAPIATPCSPARITHCCIVEKSPA